MPTFKHGKATTIWLGSLDVSQYFNNLALDVAVATAETTTFTQTYKTYVEGQAAGKVIAKGYYDQNNDASMTATLQNAGSTLTGFPAGAVAIGDLARLMKAHTVNIIESSPIGGAVLLTVGFESEGDLTFGQALHILSTDSGTTTGATKDDTAATTTGWTAHLHVTAVTGAGTWTVKLQDASAANFSDGADVTGGSFTATAAVTSQRLLSASGATLRRYVRYVATVAGGASPTITFGLAYSRAI